MLITWHNRIMFPENSKLSKELGEDMGSGTCLLPQILVQNVTIMR